MRFALRDVLLNLRSNPHQHQLRVAIYSAGEADANYLLLYVSLAIQDHRFLDDNPAYWVEKSMVWRFLRSC